MNLRKFDSKDANIIASWIKDEKSLYKWSADRIQKFPVQAKDINEFYDSIIEKNIFIPLTLVEENMPIGHLVIRYPENSDGKIVRFGFVIINPELRGQGNGKKMLQLAIEYVKNNLKASKITLGVFANNDSAKYCYEAVGFNPIGKFETYSMKIGDWECIEMELNLKY